MKTTTITIALLAFSAPLAAQGKPTAQNLIAGQPFCADSVEDLAAPGNCIPASSVPTLGMLYPLSNDFFIDFSSGFVGIGTTQPAATLDVLGPVHIDGELAVGHNVTIAALAVGSTIAGGEDNRALSSHGFIGGGFNNETGLAGSSISVAATVAGGAHNVSGGIASTIGGGSQNLADGQMATVPGGLSNRASGSRSLAAGELAEALHDNTFVWSSSDTPFASTSSDQFLVDAVGGVGLNTNEPLARLHVQGEDISASIVSASSAFGLVVEDIDAVLTLASEDQGVVSSVLSMPEFSSGVFQDHWAMYRGSNSAGADLRFSYGTSGNWFLNATILNLAANGNVGIGTTAPTQRLHVNGAMLADNYFLTSDARLKDDVHELEGSLEKLSALRGVSFVWDREQRPQAEQERQLGFLAQEVREVLPEVVREDDEGRLSVAYAQLVPVLVEAVQELEAELAQLRNQLEEKQ